MRAISYRKHSKCPRKRDVYRTDPGKTITRRIFHSSGKLLSKQEFVAGKIIQLGKALRISIQTKLYNEMKKLTSSYTTSYRWESQESNVLLSVFTINPQKQKIAVSLTSDDFKNMYGLSPGEFPKTISLKMNIEFSILNSRAQNYVTIDNWSKSESNNQIIISSTMTIKAYLLSIRIRTSKYRVKGFLTTSGILQRVKDIVAMGFCYF